MRYRNFGRTGFQISEVGYGAWGIGGTQWLGGTDDESVQAVRRAIELGLNFIDTALAYGDGHSEQLVGKLVREAGKKIYVATKVPPKNQLWPAQRGIGIEKVFPRDYIVQCTDTSLKNLGLETIDLQQLPDEDPVSVPGQFRAGHANILDMLDFKTCQREFIRQLFDGQRYIDVIFQPG